MYYHREESYRNQIIYLLIKLGMKQVDLANGLNMTKQNVNVIYRRCERKFSRIKREDLQNYTQRLKAEIVADFVIN